MMKAYSLDDWWETLTYRYTSRGKATPRSWLYFYQVVRIILRWGAR